MLFFQWMYCGLPHITQHFSYFRIIILVKCRNKKECESKSQNNRNDAQNLISIYRSSEHSFAVPYFQERTSNQRAHSYSSERSHAREHSNMRGACLIWRAGKLQVAGCEVCTAPEQSPNRIMQQCRPYITRRRIKLE